MDGLHTQMGNHQMSQQAGMTMSAMMPGQFRYPNLPHMQFAQHPQQMPVMHDAFASQIQSLQTQHQPTGVQGASAVARSVKLAAFNIFGASIREEFQKRKGNTSGRDVEKWIGQRWREMNQNERQRYHDLAQQELARRGGAIISTRKRKKSSTDTIGKRRRRALRKDPEDQFVSSTLEGEIEDVFDGGVFVNVMVDGHTPMKAVLFHPRYVAALP